MRPFLLLCALGVFGCELPPAAGFEAQALATVDAGSTQPTDGGLPPLWPVGATLVEATRRGGYPTPYCDTDAGLVEGGTYALTLPDGRLTWSVCTGYAPPNRYWSGERTLDAAELARFDGAMSAMGRSSRTISGADAPVLVLELTTPGGPVRYQDDFYADPMQPGTLFVTGMPAVFDLLDELAGISW